MCAGVQRHAAEFLPPADHDVNCRRPTQESRRATAVADCGRAPRRGGKRAADDAADVPAAGGVLHAEDRARGLHPDRGRRRGEELLVGGPGDSAAWPRAGVRRLRVTRQPCPPREVGDVVFCVEPRAVRDRRASRPARGHRLFPLGRHLQPDGDRPVLGLRQRPLHQGAGPAAVPADRRRQQPGRLGRRSYAAGDLVGSERSHAAADRRRGRARGLRVPRAAGRSGDQARGIGGAGWRPPTSRSEKRAASS